VVMGEQYSQLSIDEREMIAVLRAGGKTAREIGRVISRSHSTIVRELERNSPPVYKGYYLAHKAEERARERGSVRPGSVSGLKAPLSVPTLSGSLSQAGHRSRSRGV